MRLGLGHGLDVGYRPELFGNLALLQQYPGAAAAYSLRNIDGNTATNVVRVRRSSDNAEADFTAAEVTDGTLTTWTGANDGFVVTWYDQSGNARNATQAIAANQEVIVKAGVLVTDTAGDPCVYNFDSTLKIGCISGYDIVNSTSYSLAIVAEVKSTSTFGCVLGVNSGGASFLLVSTSGSADTLLSANFTVSNWYKNSVVGTATTRGQLYTALHTNAPLLLFTSFSTNTSFSAGNDYARIMAYSLGVTITAERKVKEWILWDSDKSADRAAIEAAINSHYSIY